MANDRDGLGIGCLAIGFSSVGMILFCTGSLLACIAPRDGQGALFSIPLWFVGAVLSLTGILIGFAGSVQAAIRYITALLALISVLSFVTAAIITG